jgi:hypothetical protein
MKNYQAWPVAIALIYGVFVLTLIGLVIFSSLHTVDLVSEDYYRREIAFQKQIERIKRSRNLPDQLSCTFDQKNACILIQFPGTLSVGNIRGEIHLFRPSDAAQDKYEQIRTDSENRQILRTHNLSHGFWRIKINWSTGQQEYFNEAEVYIQ